MTELVPLDPPVRQLVAIYAKDLNEEPETRADFKVLDQAHGSNDAFKRARSVLRKYRPIIVSIKDQHTQLQAIACLHAVKEEASLLSRAVICELALQALSANWSAMQVERFKRIADALLGGYDYFLSFTGRNRLKARAVLRVNREYEEFISKVLDSKLIAGVDRTEDNLLANVLDVLLTEKGLQGFFYPERRGDSKQVLAKLADASDLSLCFVQLLDNEMFVKQQDVAENYCHWEYVRAVANELAMLFVLPYANRNELLAAAARHEDLEEWHKTVSGADLRILPLARFNDRGNLPTIYEKIDELAAQIHTERNTAIESIPEN